MVKYMSYWHHTTSGDYIVLIIKMNPYRRACHDGTDREARMAMLLGSLYAGMASSPSPTPPLNLQVWPSLTLPVLLSTPWPTLQVSSKCTAHNRVKPPTGAFFSSNQNLHFYDDSQVNWNFATVLKSKIFKTKTIKNMILMVT